MNGDVLSESPDIGSVENGINEPESTGDGTTKGKFSTLTKLKQKITKEGSEKDKTVKKKKSKVSSRSRSFP